MPSSDPVVALVHGWGMNARVLDPLATRLATDFDVRLPELPGHGGRPERPNATLGAWAGDLVSQLPARSTLLGWSLGGQVAWRAALDHPERVERLILLSTTPRFVACGDWPHGISEASLAAFGGELVDDPRATLLRFLSLQTRGASDQRSLLAALRRAVGDAPAPTAGALRAGLALLADTDLRNDAQALAVPVLVLHGELDTLTPAAAGAWLAQTVPGARHIVYPRAGHAPHLSHPDDVAADIRRFIHDGI